MSLAEAIADLITEKFYVIKVINTNNGVRGYVFDSPDGIKIVTGGIIASITQFPTYQAAQKFIREKKLEHGSVKAYIRDNQDFIKDEANSTGMYKIDNDVFYIEDAAGAKCCFDSKRDGYFFKMCTVGYCCWETEADAKTFADAIQPNITLPLSVKKFEVKNKTKK